MHRSVLDSGEQGLVRRFLTSKPLRSVMTMLGVALGVGLFAAMTILWATLEAGLADLNRQGFGSYDFAIQAKAGFLDQEDRTRVGDVVNVRHLIDVLIISPADVPEVGIDRQYLGIGPFPSAGVTYGLQAGRYPGPGEFVMRPSAAKRLGLKVGDTVAVPFKQGARQIKLSGLRWETQLEPGESPDAFLFPLTWLQAQMGMEGKFNLLLVDAPPSDLRRMYTGLLTQQFGTSRVLRQRTELDYVRQALPAVGRFAQMIGALTLAAAALLVTGSFLTATEERLRELAMLRAVGATPEQTVRLVLREATWLGITGSLCGLLLGWGTAVVALRVQSAMVGIGPRPIVIPWVYLLFDAAAGTLLAVFAARRPARVAGQIRPSVAMRSGPSARSDQERRSMIGPVLLTLGILGETLGLLLAWGSGARALVLFAGAMAVSAGLILSSARILVRSVLALAWLFRPVFPLAARLASASVRQHSPRSAFTVSSLVIGMLLIMGIGAVNHEVTTNVLTSIKHQVIADVAIIPPDQQDLGHELPAQIQGISGVRTVVTQGSRTPVKLLGYDWSKADPAWFTEITKEPGRPSDIYKRMSLMPVDPHLLVKLADVGHVEGDLEAGATVSAVVARRLGLRLGDEVTVGTYDQIDLFNAGGGGSFPRFRIGAIVDRLPPEWREDIVVPRGTLDAPDGAVYVEVEPGRVADVKAALHNLLQTRSLGMATVRDFKAETDQAEGLGRLLWSVLGAAMAVVVLVSVFGLVNTLVAGLHARRRELALLRAVGSTPWQMAGQVMLEAVMMALCGGATGFLAGGAVVLAFVNGMQLSTYALPLYLGAAVSGGSAVLACLVSLGPAWSVTRGSVSEVLRGE